MEITASTVEGPISSVTNLGEAVADEGHAVMVALMTTGDKGRTGAFGDDFLERTKLNTVDSITAGLLVVPVKTTSVLVASGSQGFASQY